MVPSDILLSIIIPAYNVELYIKECLDSIYNSISTSDIPYVELIIINNGSNDNTQNILDEYSRSRKMTVISICPNEGISNARNRGLRAANGKYVMLMDSDDYLLSGALGKILDFIRGHIDIDIIEFGYCESFEGEGTIVSKTEMPSLTTGTGQEIFAAWISDGFFNALVWTKIVLRSLIIENQIFFYPNISYEDEEWSPRIFAYAQQAAFLPIDVYVYRRRKGSVTLTDIKVKTLDMATVCDSLVKFANNNFSKQYILALYRCASNIYWGMFVGLKDYGQYDEKTLKLLCERSYLIAYSKNFKRRYIYRALIGIIGVKGLYFFRCSIKNFLHSKKRP